MQRDSGLWQAVLGEIELSVSRGNFVTWFKKTQLLQHTDESVVVGVPNVFIKHQLESKYTDLILKTLKKNGVEPGRIDYKISQIVQQLVVPDVEPETRTVFAPAVAPRLIVQQRSSNSLTHNYRQGLNERYTFENFVVGSSNELAYAACQAVAADIGTRYNPLFLYGGVGIGKTHLIQAAGNAVLAKKARARVVYASSEQFVQEFVDALRFKKTTDFAKHYRGADVLIVDDMQFIAGKEKVQEEFFHTFNALHQANKQIIISSDKPPSEIPTLEERLRSRFAWGMTIDMQNPDFETRCAIIQTKAGQHEIHLPADVVEYLANLVQTNIRELEGALNQLLAFCEMRNLTPDIITATGLLGTAKTRPRHLSTKQIIERTARHFQISIEEIIGPKRDKDIVVPRQVAMYLLRSELHLSFPKIARELGRKDHTTAIHSVEKIEKESRLDTNIRDAIKEIRERLYV
ncbi:MAG TPA: chromosomal replication initiator protein DnaA [Candidatus Saccharimonadales bacterium]|jgi:chromosomal replication initiator protein